MATPRRSSSRSYAERIAATLYGGRARLDPVVHAAMTARYMRPPSAYGYLTQVYAITGWSSLPWLWRLGVPTLVLNGDDDPVVPAVNGRIMAAFLPHARWTVLKGAGHLFLLDQSEDAAELVHAFLVERVSGP